MKTKSGNCRLFAIMGLIASLWTIYYFFFAAATEGDVKEGLKSSIEYCFHIAGYPDCGYFLRARSLAKELETLQPKSPAINLTFRIKEITRGLAWDDYRSSLFNKRFPQASNHRTSPIVYYDKCGNDAEQDVGVFIGGFDKFSEFFSDNNNNEIEY